MAKLLPNVPKIGAAVTGATHDEALTNAQRAIVASMIAEAEKSKQRQEKDHGVAGDFALRI